MTKITMPILKRIIEIHNKIKSGRYPNTPSIARDLEISTATVSRVISFIKNDLEAPLEFSKEHNGYYYTREYELCFKCE